MANMNELVKKVVPAITGNTTNPNWFSNIELKCADSYMELFDATNCQGDFGIVGFKLTGI